MKKGTVRFAVLEDLDRIEEIENNSFETPWTREALRMEIEQIEMSDVFVIEDNGDVIGYMSYMKIIDEAHINNIAVDKKYRGLGYGRVLVSEIVNNLLKEGFSVTLEVREDNNAAISLYESLGFKEAGVRKDYYGIGRNGLIMWNRR